VEKTKLRGALWSVLFNKYYSGDQIKKNEMGRARDTCERQEMGVQGFGGKTRGKKPLGRPRLRGRKLLKWIFKNWDGEASAGLIWFRIGTGGGRL
jgi:hypothetical protein